MNTQSILNPHLYGVISVTGLYGVGKTTFATTAERPDLTAIIDFDLKFKAEAERLGFWYRSPDHIDDVLSIDFARMVTWFKQALAEIPAGTTVVSIDNAAPLEGLLGYVVAQAPEKYGVNPTNARSGSFGGVNPGISRLWKNITLHLQRKGVKVIFVVSHVGSPWVNGQPVPNRYRGKGNKALQEMSNLSVVLVRDKSFVPAGIVLKEQFAQRAFGPDGWNVQRVLPLRFPRASWKDILAYFDTPADFDNPKPGELPSKEELEMYGELFSAQQLEFIKAVANGQFVEDGEAPVFVEPEQQPAPSQPHKETNGHPTTGGKGKVATTPMTAYWVKVKELGLPNGKDILAGYDGDPVKALAAIEGMSQVAPEAEVV